MHTHSPVLDELLFISLEVTSQTGSGRPGGLSS